jgi:taurine--2-oxoglutarate transaminase
MARLHNGRPKVLAAYRSYHGSTTTSIHLTGDPRRWASDSGAGAVHFFGPFLYRSAFGSTTPEEERERALAHLEQVILLVGPSTISALVLEPVTGSSGVIVPPAGYRRGVRDLCTHHGSGYVPLGGVLVGDPIYETFTQRPYPVGMTHSGHQLACAAAVGAIGAMHDEGTFAAAARLGTDTLEPGLEKLAENHPSVGDVRGIGGLWTVELVRDRETKEPLVAVGATGEANAPMTAFAKACLDRGLVPLILGNRIHVAPLNVSDSDAAGGLAILDEALAEADTFLG